MKLPFVCHFKFLHYFWQYSYWYKQFTRTKVVLSNTCLMTPFQVRNLKPFFNVISDITPKLKILFLALEVYFPCHIPILDNLVISLDSRKHSLFQTLVHCHNYIYGIMRNIGIFISSDHVSSDFWYFQPLFILKIVLDKPLKNQDRLKLWLCQLHIKYS